MADVPEILDHIEENTDLDVVAITDHDHVRGAWRAREVWANGRYRFELIVGVEVTTIEGHLLALFIEDPIDSLVPVEQALEAVRAQEGICIVPHPMSWATRSLDKNALIRIRDYRDSALRFDAIETATGSAAGRLWTRRAARLNDAELGLPPVGGSDAHFTATIGSAYTTFEGHSGGDLKRSILNGTTSAEAGSYPSVLELGIGQVMRQTWRGLNTTPRTMGLSRTAYSFFQRIFNVR
jgi:predicted metal-dependent phosphoesterase TrpH